MQASGSPGPLDRKTPSGRTIIVQDINDDSDYLQRAVPRARLPTGTVSFIALPISMGGRIVGVLGVHRL
ncbi:GAF domain-containing protein, partial [Ferrovum sp.]|uniref:GAF domain-containing protein n=1 Tax=Ferrovum sp. TaxID=2609467 RepID=UPI00345755F1